MRGAEEVTDRKSIVSVLPDLVAEILRFLVDQKHNELAQQLPCQFITHWTLDQQFPQYDVIFMHLGGQRPLNVVEQNVIGVRRGASISLGGTSGTVVLDCDNFGRANGIEVIGRPAVRQALENLIGKPSGESWSGQA